MFILLPVLFIMGGLSILSPARLTNVFSAQRDAYQSATTPLPDVPLTTVTPSESDITLDDDLAVLQSSANHLYDSQTQTTVQSHSAWNFLPAVTLTDNAEVAGGPWTFSGYPVTADGAILETWSLQSAVETNDADIWSSLQLRQGWPADGSGE